MDDEDDFWDVPTMSQVLQSTRMITQVQHEVRNAAEEVLGLLREFLREDEEDTDE